jgi:hypothetical protein
MMLSWINEFAGAFDSAEGIDIISMIGKATRVGAQGKTNSAELSATNFQPFGCWRSLY